MDGALAGAFLAHEVGDAGEGGLALLAAQVALVVEEVAEGGSRLMGGTFLMAKVARRDGRSAGRETTR